MEMKPEDMQGKNHAQQAFSRRGFLKSTAALAIVSSTVGAAFAKVSEGRKILAYVGTYTGAIGNGGNGEGIYLFELNPKSGALTKIKLAAESASPSWIAIDPTGRYL